MREGGMELGGGGEEMGRTMGGGGVEGTLGAARDAGEASNNCG